MPTVHGTIVPGMCFSIANLDRQPEQWPGMSTAGSSRFRSATVLWIWASSLMARWNPPTTACSGVLPPTSLDACFAVLTTPAWLHPVKTTSPFPGMREKEPKVLTLGVVITLEIAHEEALVGDKFVRDPFFLLGIEPHRVSEACLVRCDPGDLPRDEKHIVKNGVRLVMLVYYCASAG